MLRYYRINTECKVYRRKKNDYFSSDYSEDLLKIFDHSQFLLVIDITMQNNTGKGIYIFWLSLWRTLSRNALKKCRVNI